MAEVDLGKVVGPQGDPGAKGEKGDPGPQGPQGPSGVVDGDSTITFTTPETYQEPQSGDSISNLFGRFKRWILDLQSNIGSLGSLKTPAKSSLVAGVNANYDTIAQLEEDVGNPTDLTTDAKDIVGAVNELNSALNQYSKDFLGLKDEQVIRRKTYVGTDLSCNIADGNLYRCSALTINISELGFRTLGDVKAHFLQTSSNSTPILGVSIYGQATKDTVKVLVWTPTLKTVDSISITLECVGTI